MNRIHSIQKILDKDGFLKGTFRPGILGAETLDALCAWCMYKRHASATPDELIPSVDFPQFVGDLIQGVFNANLGLRSNKWKLMSSYYVKRQVAFLHSINTIHRHF